MVLPWEIRPDRRQPHLRVAAGPPEHHILSRFEPETKTRQPVSGSAGLAATMSMAASESLVVPLLHGTRLPHLGEMLAEESFKLLLLLGSEKVANLAQHLSPCHGQVAFHHGGFGCGRADGGLIEIRRMDGLSQGLSRRIPLLHDRGHFLMIRLHLLVKGLLLALVQVQASHHPAHHETMVKVLSHGSAGVTHLWRRPGGTGGQHQKDHTSHQYACFSHGLSHLQSPFFVTRARGALSM